MSITPFYKLDMPEEMNCTTEFDSHFKLEPGANLKIIELLIMLHQNTHPSGEIGKLRIKELFLSLMHQVLIACSYRENDSSPNQKMVDEALAYIKLHYMNSLTLGELAERHAMSTNRFSYFFHKYTGCVQSTMSLIIVWNEPVTYSKQAIFLFTRLRTVSVMTIRSISADYLKRNSVLLHLPIDN